MNFTLEQLKERQQGLGGSELAAALGLSPWKTPYELYIEKTTEDPLSLQKAMTAPQEWGHRLEEVVAQKYQEETGHQLLSGFWYTHTQFPWLTATPDYLIFPRDNPGRPFKGLEIKTVDAFCRDKWGPSGTTWDGKDINDCPIPYHYYLQVAQYMMVVDTPEWDLAVLIGGNDYRLYTLTRNLENEQMMLEEASTFWERFVVPRIAPPVDFTSEGVQALIAQINQPREEVAIDLNEEWSQRVHQVRETSEITSLAIKRVKEIKAELRHFMGNASIARLQGGGAVCVKIAKDGSARMTFRE